MYNTHKIAILYALCHNGMILGVPKHPLGQTVALAHAYMHAQNAHAHAHTPSVHLHTWKKTVRTVYSLGKVYNI